MKKIGFILFYLIGFLFSSLGQLVLVDNKKSEYKIVVPQNSNVETTSAAQLLRNYINKKSAVSLEIISENQYHGNRAIFVGKTKMFISKINAKKIKRLGYAIGFNGSSIILGGVTDRGTRNSIYGFLDKYLDIQMLASDDIYYRSSNSIIIKDPITQYKNPAFDTYDIFNSVSYSDKYAEWHSIEHNYKAPSKWGIFDHSFFRLIPPDKYSESNPDFFLYKNEVPTQLNLANRLLRKKIIDTLRKAFQHYPQLKNWMIGQEDIGEFGNLYKTKETLLSFFPSVSDGLIDFINSIALQYPEKTIGTFAYHETLNAPLIKKPSKNVLICFAPIDAFRQIPLNKGDNLKYGNELQKWSKITSSLMVWDYIGNYSNSVMPFPGFFTIADNLSFYGQNNVTSLFLQGVMSNEEPFSEMITFLCIKKIWGDNRSTNQILEEFCTKFYSTAASEILRFINQLRINIEENNDKIRFFGGSQKYLSLQCLLSYDKILANAIIKAGNNTILINKINKLRIGIDYKLANTSEAGKKRLQRIKVTAGFYKIQNFKLEDKTVSIKDIVF